MEKLKIH